MYSSGRVLKKKYNVGNSVVMQHLLSEINVPVSWDNHDFCYCGNKG
jgi:hypothetical protein